jgi:phospholipase C
VALPKRAVALVLALAVVSVIVLLVLAAGGSRLQAGLQPRPEGAAADVHGGRMDGFIAQAEGARAGCKDPFDPACGGTGTDVMGYHDQREIPNYWAYARHFVLQDRMFEPNASWSLPEHLFMVSEWSAKCRNNNPRSRGSFVKPAPTGRPW